MERTDIRPDAVNLKSDESAGVLAVVEVRAGDAVDPGTDVIALGYDAVVIPLTCLEGSRCAGLVGEVIMPLGPPAFVPEVSGRALGVGGHFALVAVDLALDADAIAPEGWGVSLV